MCHFFPPYRLGDYSPAAKPGDNQNFLSLAVCGSIECLSDFVSLHLWLQIIRLSCHTVNAAIQPHGRYQRLATAWISREEVEEGQMKKMAKKKRKEEEEEEKARKAKIIKMVLQNETA